MLLTSQKRKKKNKKGKERKKEEKKNRINNIQNTKLETVPAFKKKRKRLAIIGMT